MTKNFPTMPSAIQLLGYQDKYAQSPSMKLLSQVEKLTSANSMVARVLEQQQRTDRMLKQVYAYGISNPGLDILRRQEQELKRYAAFSSVTPLAGLKLPALALSQAHKDQLSQTTKLRLDSQVLASANRTMELLTGLRFQGISKPANGSLPKSLEQMMGSTGLKSPAWQSIMQAAQKQALAASSIPSALHAYFPDSTPAVAQATRLSAAVKAYVPLFTPPMQTALEEVSQHLPETVPLDPDDRLNALQEAIVRAFTETQAQLEKLETIQQEVRHETQDLAQQFDSFQQQYKQDQKIANNIQLLNLMLLVLTFLFPASDIGNAWRATFTSQEQHQVITSQTASAATLNNMAQQLSQRVTSVNIRWVGKRPAIVRTTSKSGSHILGKIAPSLPVVVLARGGKWVKVESLDGSQEAEITGWILKKYLVPESRN